jgi:hypothetical protein
MVNSLPIFSLFSVSDDTQDFLAKARAADEHISLPKYLAGMLRHASRGENLANTHVYLDGSDDTYRVSHGALASAPLVTGLGIQ